MATSKTVYLGDLRTKASHIFSGNEIITDAPLDNHGKGQAFSPTDLVATALTSCMMTIMGIEAQKLKVDLNGLSAETTKIMSKELPRKIVEIHIKFVFPVLEIKQEDLVQLKKAALACPVALSLHPNIKQLVDFGF
jgi:putative redox protein